jgi:hypothetical protein
MDGLETHPTRRGAIGSHRSLKRKRRPRGKARAAGVWLFSFACASGFDRPVVEATTAA